MTPLIWDINHFTREDQEKGEIQTEYIVSRFDNGYLYIFINRWTSKYFHL